MAGELKHKSVGTQLTQAEFEAVDEHIFDSQATGDIMYATSSTQLSRLGIGASGDLLEVVSGVPAWKAAASVDFKGARVFNSANQSIPGSTWTSLTFDSERYDSDSMHSSVTNSSRLTANTPGKYLITGGWAWAASAPNLIARILYNASISIVTVQDGAGLLYNGNCSTIYNLASNDFVELQLYQNLGSAINSVLSPNAAPEFSMQLLR